MKTKFLVPILIPLLTVSAAAQTKYILRYTESAPLASFLSQYQLTLEATVAQRPIHSVIDPLGRDPLALIQQISDDTDDDVSIEQDQILRLPILAFPRRQSSSPNPLLAAMNAQQLVNFFGKSVRRGYITQFAVGQTRTSQSWASHGGGTGMVAVIDTGIDANHPIFAGGTVPGIDFLDPNGNGSELQGLSQQVLAYINPTTTPLLQKVSDLRSLQYISNGHAMQQNSKQVRLNSGIPLGLGHGTMVAGAVKLVAPNATILPIRAFSQDGSGRLFHVISGIHAAEIRGAKVINLSLNTYTHSPELERTTADVSDRGVILVASTGNNGLTNVPSYPASYSKVTGVASVNGSWQRSPFSNAGASLTWLAAPGEGLYLPFPGNRYAGGWGTSFSAPLVSGMDVFGAIAGL
jgi:subtilisin family serine protease